MAQNIHEPNVSVSSTPTGAPIPVAPKVTTFIGQMTSSGTATAGAVVFDVDVNTEDTLFGADSMIATAIRNFRKYNQVSTINAIPLDDAGAAVAATGNVTFTSGPASAASSIDVYTGSTDRKYTLDISATDDVTAIGDALVAAITADTQALVSAVNTGGDVALTAVNKGTVGNEIGIRVDGTIAGVSTAITAMSSGATDPAMTGIADLITFKTDIVMPYEYGITTFETLLENRYNFNNVAEDGRLFTAITDTKANLVTVLAAENARTLVLFCDKPVAKAAKTGSAIFEMPLNKSAQFAGVRTFRLEDGTSITSFVATTASKDQRGGVQTSSLPYHNTPLSSLGVIPTGEGFTDDEKADLQDDGGTVMGNNRANNTIIVGRVSTTYKTNAQGLADVTYKFLNYVDEDTACREYILNNLSLDYAQARLSAGQAVSGRGIATVGGVKADMVKYYTALSSGDFVLLQGGVIQTEGINKGRTVGEVFKENLTVTFDLENGIINIEGILPLMSQVRDISTVLQISFDPNNVQGV
jgi:phage tail sheath gpL-like